jgi:hypothetical protein
MILPAPYEGGRESYITYVWTRYGRKINFIPSDRPYDWKILGKYEYVVEGFHQPRFAGFLTRQTGWSLCGSSRGPDSSSKGH